NRARFASEPASGIPCAPPCRWRNWDNDPKPYQLHPGRAPCCPGALRRPGGWDSTPVPGRAPAEFLSWKENQFACRETIVVLLVIRPCGIGGIRRPPCNVGLGNVHHQGLPMLGDVLIDRGEFRIVRHDELAFSILDLHAAVLPEFHRDRALFKVLIELLDAVLNEGRLIELIGIERGTQGHETAACFYQSESIGNLWSKLLTVGESVVDHQNINKREVRFFEQSLQCGIG